MKLKAIFCLFICAIYSIFSSVANASQVCVIDVEKIVFESKAGKVLSQKLDSKISILQKTTSANEKLLMKDRHNIETNQSTMTKEELAKKKKKFEQDVMEFKKNIAEERAKIEKMKTKGLEQIDNAVRKIAKDISKENGYEIMLPLSVALFYDDKIDITKELMIRLNKKLITVEIE
jgi:outer membrane protein